MKTMALVSMVGIAFVGCTGERELKSVSPSGLETTQVLGPQGTCSQGSRNTAYVGRVLDVAVTLRGETAHVTLTPAAAGLGGGSWTLDGDQVTLNWSEDDTLEAELVVGGKSLGKRNGGLEAKHFFGEVELSLVGKVEQMGDTSAGAVEHTRAKVTPNQVPNCECSASACAAGRSCCVKSSLCCNCCNAGCNSCKCVN